MNKTLSNKVLRIQEENTNLKSEIEALRVEVNLLKDLFVKCFNVECSFNNVNDSVSCSTQSVQDKSNNDLKIDLDSYKDNVDFKLFQYVTDKIKDDSIYRIPSISHVHKFFKVVFLNSTKNFGDLHDLFDYCNNFGVDVSFTSIVSYSSNEFDVYKMYPTYTKTIKMMLRDINYSNDLNDKLNELNIDIKKNIKIISNICRFSDQVI